MANSEQLKGGSPIWSPIPFYLCYEFWLKFSGAEHSTQWQCCVVTYWIDTSVLVKKSPHHTESSNFSFFYHIFPPVAKGDMHFLAPQPGRISNLQSDIRRKRKEPTLKNSFYMLPFLVKSGGASSDDIRLTLFWKY